MTCQETKYKNNILLFFDKLKIELLWPYERNTKGKKRKIGTSKVKVLSDIGVGRNIVGTLII